MSTNYFIPASSPCPECGHEEEPQMIAKFAGGWRAMFRTYPGLETWDDWVNHLESIGHLVDEYGEGIDAAEFLSRCVLRSDLRSHADEYEGVHEKYADMCPGEWW